MLAGHTKKGQRLAHTLNLLLASVTLHWSPVMPSLLISFSQSCGFKNVGAGLTSLLYSSLDASLIAWAYSKAKRRDKVAGWLCLAIPVVTVDASLFLQFFRSNRNLLKSLQVSSISVMARGRDTFAPSIFLRPPTSKLIWSTHVIGMELLELRARKSPSVLSSFSTAPEAGMNDSL